MFKEVLEWFIIFIILTLFLFLNDIIKSKRYQAFIKIKEDNKNH